MVLKNSFNFLTNFTLYFFDRFRKLYLKSSYYNNKISKTDDKILEYIDFEEKYQVIFSNIRFIF